MAASIRQQPFVKNNIVKLLKLAKIRLRCKPSNTECLVRNKHSQKFTQNSEKTSLTKPGSEETDANAIEDFFGIPDDYKLQHARLNSNWKPPETQSSLENNEKLHMPNEVYDTAETSSYDQAVKKEKNFVDEKFRSRHICRKQKTVLKANFPTSFGVISFDQAAYLKSEGQIDMLALKAQEILNKSDIHDTPDFEISNSQTSAKRTRHAVEEDESQNEGQNIFDEQYFGSVDSGIVDQETIPTKTNFIEKSYFVNETKPAESGIPSSKLAQNWLGYLENKGNITEKYNQQNHSTPRSSSNHTENNLFDEQYFDNVLNKSKVNSHWGESGNEVHSGCDQSHSCQEGYDLSEIDKQYFDRSAVTSGNPPSLGEVAKQYFKSDNQGSDFLDSCKTFYKSQNGSDTDQIHHSLNTNYSAVKSTPLVKNSKVRTRKTVTENVVTNQSFLKKQEKRQKAYVSKIHNVEPESNSAFQFAMKVRQNLQTEQKEKNISEFKIPRAYDTQIDENDGMEMMGKNCRFDSKGYRILDLQVPNFDRVTSSDAIRMLKSRIIFNHDDFLAIDKPYGLPSFGQKNDRLSVSSLLPALVSSLPHSYQACQLHIVQGLDRDVTGTLILAKSPELAQDLKLMYTNSERCIQRFWALTKGVPKPPEGTVDIPIGEARIGGKFRPVLRPLYRPSLHPGVKLSKAPSEAATTEYKVLSRNMKVGLVECTPLTNGIKHQLRVHLAYGLNTPILGDHKYSHIARLAPQKLDANTLALLKIRQAKVRHLALHLHLRSVMLTDYKGKMIFLTTRPPMHFLDNLRSLKLQMPKK